MKRILLISDTHGSVDDINELVKLTGAHAVIHAGDFGFYETESVNRLSDRELRLLIIHSSARSKISQQTTRDELVSLVVKNKLLGDFQDYLSKKKRFSVPVYAVWGNHEDNAVIHKLREGISIDNLYILDERHIHEIAGIRLFGIGGNFLKGKKLFGPSLSGTGGKIWSTLHQYGALYQQMKNKKEKPSIFVSHVSPGKEPLLARLMIHFKPDFWISGHMGTPYTCVWNQFTVRGEEDAIEWLNQKVECKGKNLTDEALVALDLISRPLPGKDFWFKHLWNINLPDVRDGYALFNISREGVSLETFSKGLKLLK